MSIINNNYKYIYIIDKYYIIIYYMDKIVCSRCNGDHPNLECLYFKIQKIVDKFKNLSIKS